MLGPLSYITLVPVMFVTRFNDYKKDLIFFFPVVCELVGVSILCFFFFTNIVIPWCYVQQLII